MADECNDLFPREWEEKAAYFCWMNNSLGGASPEENTPYSNWFLGLGQLRSGSWQWPWSGPDIWS